MMSEAPAPFDFRAALRRGLVVPAHPLALDANRKFDPRRQRALTRYYLDAGAGGLAVGVHTTQFAIRDPKVGLFRPVLELAAETIANHERAGGPGVVRIAGACGATPAAVAEAALARDLGYHAVLLSLAALRDASDDALVAHCAAVADTLPIVGFYLQPAVGGRPLGYRFWRRLAETVPDLVAVKIAPFDRYRTLDVVRAVADSGRASEIALYTGNDDHIILDLIAEYRVAENPEAPPVPIVGGLLGQWACWTRAAVDHLERCRAAREAGAASRELLILANALTDANAALFDAANAFAGCIPGVHEALRRSGLLENVLTLDPLETFGPGQPEAIDRVHRLHPELRDDDFVRANLDRWLA